MKVLHININYIGTTLHQNMINVLESFGVENSVFVPTYNKNLAVINVNDNVVVSECFKKRDRISFFYKQRKIFHEVDKCFNIEKYNMVHAYTLFTDGNIALTLKKKYGIPYVVAIRDTDLNTFFKWRFYLRGLGVKIMEEAEAIFFLSSSYMKTTFERYIPLELHEEIFKKSYVVPNGIDEFWFKNKNDFCKNTLNKNEIIKVVYVGQISKRKNVETTLKANKVLRERGYKVSFVVAGPSKSKRILKKIRRDKHTTYLGPKPKEELIKLYREGDIFVMPSLTETFGLVYAEAMTQALPIIYTRNEGFDGQFEEGVVGYPVNPRSPVDIADKIELVINKYEQLVENCISLSYKFKWDDIAYKYVGIYKAIV